MGLPDGGLMSLCSTLKLNVPVVNVQEDFDYMRDTNNFSGLATVAVGSSIWRDSLSRDDLESSGRELNKEGYCLITVETVKQELCMQDLEKAGTLMIGCNGHYFVFDRSNILEKSTTMRE